MDPSGKKSGVLQDATGYQYDPYGYLPNGYAIPFECIGSSNVIACASYRYAMDALTSLPDVSGLLAHTSGATGTAAGVLAIACLATGPGVLACEGGAGILKAISLTSGAGATAMDCNKEASGGGCIVGLVALGTVGVSPVVEALRSAGFVSDVAEMSAEAVGKFLFLPFVMAAPIISIANE